MVVQRYDYDRLLAQYSNRKEALGLLRQYRPYLEFVPSMRRPAGSIISIPLPIARVRKPPELVSNQSFVPVSQSELRRIPCDLVVLMCDPDWKIKTGVEIFIFIYRPDECFSDLLGRWRQTQIFLDQGYEWLMPPQHRYIYGEGSGQGEIYPLFVLFPDTPARVERGLKGSGLPFVIPDPAPEADQELDGATNLADVDSELLSDLRNSDLEEGLFSD